MNCRHLIVPFMNSFYGYGNYQGYYWFIGMEEGGGNDCNEIDKSLCAWGKLGQPELADLYQFHHLISIIHFFQPPVKLQKTWAKLIRILLCIQGKSPSIQDIRDYQSAYLGRSDAETCLLELLPLPSPSINHWIYSDCFDLPELSDRKKYECHYIPQRKAHFQQQISQYKPKLVIFYGTKYLHYWQCIVNIPLIYCSSLGIHVGCNDHTVFIVIKHPVARGVPNTYFDQVGQIARQLLAQGCQSFIDQNVSETLTILANLKKG